MIATKLTPSNRSYCLNPSYFSNGKHRNSGVCMTKWHSPVLGMLHRIVIMTIHQKRYTAVICFCLWQDVKQRVMLKGINQAAYDFISRNTETFACINSSSEHLLAVLFSPSLLMYARSCCLNLRSKNHGDTRILSISSASSATLKPSTIFRAFC